MNHHDASTDVGTLGAREAGDLASALVLGEALVDLLPGDADSPTAGRCPEARP